MIYEVFIDEVEVILLSFFWYKIFGEVYIFFFICRFCIIVIKGWL